MLPTTKDAIYERATEGQILQSLALLAGLPSRQADDAQFDQDVFFVALEGVTRQSLSLAVKAVIQGRLGHTFFPTPVELRLQCDKAFSEQQRSIERQRLMAAQREENRRMAEFDAQHRTPEAKARVADLMARFHNSHDSAKRDAEEAERAEIRARYGMTPETLAGIKDQPVPANFDQVGQAARKSA